MAWRDGAQGMHWARLGSLVVVILIGGCANGSGEQRLGVYASSEQQSLKDDLAVSRPIRIAMQPAGARSVGADRATAKRATADPMRRPDRAAAAATRPNSPAPAAETAQDLLAACGDDSDCRTELPALVGAPSREWMKTPPEGKAVIAGARLLAYRLLRSKLSCDELATALAESEEANRQFVQIREGLSLDRAARFVALNYEVTSQLKAEQASRC